METLEGEKKAKPNEANLQLNLVEKNDEEIDALTCGNKREGF
jgi:hypothetical protein